MDFTGCLSPKDKEAFETYLTNYKVHDLLTDIVIQLALHKPENPVTFLQNYLKNRPEPATVQSVNTEMDESAQEETIQPDIPTVLPNRRRRGAVSSEPAADDGPVEITSHPKTDEQKQALKGALSNHILCSHLDTNELAEVFDAMFEITFVRGDTIIKQGAQA